MFEVLKGRPAGHGMSPEARRVIPEGVTQEEIVDYLEQARQFARTRGKLSKEDEMALQGEREMVKLTVCDIDQPAVVEKNGVLQDVVGIWGPDLDRNEIPENCPRLISFDSAKKLGCIGCDEKKIVIEEIEV